jgi:hypothetical protein
MPSTYEPIATTTLGTAGTTITFTSIPSTYTDLKLVLSVSSFSTANEPILRFNNDSGANYAWTRMIGTGSSRTSNRITGIGYLGFDQATSATGKPLLFSYDIFSYASSIFKPSSYFAANNIGVDGGYVMNSVGIWRSTATINRVDLALINGGNYNIGTMATLYGIKAA